MLAPHISVVNLGCRVNRVESDRITADLMRLGFAMVEPRDADLIVINTCAVTGEAEAKTRKAVRRAAGIELSAALARELEGVQIPKFATDEYSCRRVPGVDSSEVR